MLVTSGEKDWTGFWPLNMLRQRFKLLWPRYEDCISGVGVMVKDQLCVMVVEIRMVSDRVIVLIVLLLEEGVLKLICGYAM